VVAIDEQTDEGFREIAMKFGVIYHTGYFGVDPDAIL
jgi:hypothetical protein